MTDFLIIVAELADVIIVDGDPLKDTEAMKRVILVIKNGEIVSASE